MLRDLRYLHSLTIKELSESLSIDEKRIKVIERGFDSPTTEEQQLMSNFFLNDKVEFKKNIILKKGHLIGEGYVTAINKDPKIYQPVVDKIENKLKVFDLFCGIGGISYGFEQTSNFTTIGGLDLLNDRIKTFQLNHKHSFGFSFDINSFKPYELEKHLSEKPDIIVGGAPCQGFSSIRPFRSITEDDIRNNLFRAFATYIHHFKPAWFVFENVVGLLSHKGGETIKTLIKEFKSLGYKVDFKILNSAFYGAPQLRERLIIVGNRKNIDFAWPQPTHYYEYKSMAGNNNPSVLKPNSNLECFPATTVMDAISDLPSLNSGEKAIKYLKNNSLTNYQKYLVEDSTNLTHHDSTVHSKQMLNIIKQSGYNIDSVKHLITSGFSTSYSRLEPNKPSVTLTVNFVNPSSNKCIHPIQNRALTPREGARIQGLPDKFNFFGTRTQIVKQIGNAVPPVLSKVIAESIFKYY